MSDWIVIGIYCDGRDGHRHQVESIRFYRRLADPDGTHVWAQLHSDPHRANGPGLRDTRTWLDDGAHEQFWCRRCESNTRKRWDDVERVLDAAYGLDRKQLMLREWQGRV